LQFIAAILFLSLQLVATLLHIDEMTVLQSEKYCTVSFCRWYVITTVINLVDPCHCLTY